MKRRDEKELKLGTAGNVNLIGRKGMTSFWIYFNESLDNLEGKQGRMFA